MSHAGNASKDELAYVGGAVVPASLAKVPIWDRGFLFAEAAYEAYIGRGGRVFGYAEHQDRLRRTLEGIRIPEVDAAMREVDSARDALLSAFGRGTFLLYVQVTGGVAPRLHVLPKDPPPAVYAILRPFDLASLERDQTRGLRATTCEDLRWRRATFKTTQLLPNILGKKSARDRGADEVLFLDAKDGAVLEGGATNVFWIEKGVAYTPPLSRNLLPGVTRRVVRERCGVTFEEAEAPLPRLMEAEEVFVAGTTREATAVVEIDGVKIGAGVPGPFVRDLARRIRAAFDKECPA
jgi:D-alanine transaminase